MNGSVALDAPLAPPRLAVASTSLPMDGAGIVTVSEYADLSLIHDCSVQGIHLPRAGNAEIDRELEQQVALGTLGSSLRVQVPAAELAAGRLPSGLPSAPALLDDVARLCELYADLVGCPWLGLRFVVLDSTMCPRFHVDRVGVRLLCTYRGPGTEWAAREALLPAVDTPASTGRALPHDILLLKGSAWPDNGLRGAVHRSPVAGCGVRPRVLLSIDAVWDH
jgi:hypothetical protein